MARASEAVNSSTGFHPGHASYNYNYLVQVFITSTSVSNRLPFYAQDSCSERHTTRPSGFRCDLGDKPATIKLHVNLAVVAHKHATLAAYLGADTHWLTNIEAARRELRW